MNQKQLNKHLEQIRIGDFQGYNINCEPVGQRPPVEAESNDETSKAVGIIKFLFEGGDFGTITIMRTKVDDDNYEYESIDGGHRKRAIKDFMQDKFEVDGKYYRQLSDKEKKLFKNIELTFCIYDYLENDVKGKIFRTLNKTTDVNFMEMMNSYGDTLIANLIRNIVRVMDENSPPHSLFDGTYVNYGNLRLKVEHLVARIAYRYYLFITKKDSLFGGSSDTDIESMYQDITVNEDLIQKLQKCLTRHFTILQNLAILTKKHRKGNKLSAFGFKTLSYILFYIYDTYGYDTKIDKLDKFFKCYDDAHTNLVNTIKGSGKYVTKYKVKLDSGRILDVSNISSDYDIPNTYKRYIGAPHDTKKVKIATNLLLTEMGDIEQFLIIKDKKRVFSELEKKQKLIDQNHKCAVDGQHLDYDDAEGGHIVSHANGGKTTYSNLVMIRRCYNKEMGSTDFNVYMAGLKAA